MGASGHCRNRVGGYLQSSGNVQMRPCYALGKLFQKRGGGNRSGFASADVFNVGDVGLDLL